MSIRNPILLGSAALCLSACTPQWDAQMPKHAFHNQVTQEANGSWRVTPPDCSHPEYAGHLGCATETNLGLMVADPEDLVHGSGRSSPDVERSGKVLQDYRSGKDYRVGQQPASSSQVTEGVADLTGN